MLVGIKNKRLTLIKRKVSIVIKNSTDNSIRNEC